MRIGLTGGIGCGKSTAGKLLAELGWGRIDTDELVRELLTTDMGLQAALKARWGDQALLPEGGANRSFIASKVFNDRDALTWWENQILPKVRTAWANCLLSDPDRDWVVEAPLLFEKGLKPHFHVTLCVEAPEYIQLERLAAKGLDRGQSMARINNQMPVVEKVRRANIVLSNAGSFDFLQRQVERASEMLRKLPLNS